jgi:GTPase
MTTHAAPLKPAEFAREIRTGSRAALAKAITYAESERPEHEAFTAKLLDALLPATGNSIRVGVTGVPGVGKSTFIQAFGLALVGQGKRVGVLAVDPSSLLTGGSILGDKTRMGALATSEDVFIRPSPASGHLGGVAHHTREAILLLEAAGFDAILVETVGAGQSESEVANMVDAVVLLLLPGAGDELQAIKKGVLELADVLVVHKAEGENKKRAERAGRDLKAALRLRAKPEDGWTPPVLLASSVSGEGLPEVWDALMSFEDYSKKSTLWEKKRKQQNGLWLAALIEQGLKRRLHGHAKAKKLLKALAAEVEEGALSPAAAALRVLAAFPGG